MKKEYKRIRAISKKIISRDQYKKIKKIKDYTERTQGLKYLVASKLKLKLLELELNSREIDKKEALLIESKLILLQSKIKIFESTHSKRDYKILQKIIQEIEKEINVCTNDSNG